MDQPDGSSHAGESIKVFVRVRPPDHSLDSDLQQGFCLDVSSDSSLVVHSKPDPKTYTFDHVAGENTTQEDVFSAVGRPIIDCCMHGYNGTIFAYGQTGSGKTFTMIGPPSDESEDTFNHPGRGIIPRSFEYLFSLIERNKKKYGDLVEFLCKCSFLEIYNEQVYDLLDSSSCGLHLRENMKRGVYVDGLIETSISSAKEAYQVLSMGWGNRKVASTSMNRESSRSHAVFTLSVESKKREVKDAVAKIRTSLLNLVDLAGSERQRDTRAVGLRLKEAGNINKSLSALGNVIMALVDIANGKSRHIHYRDSKLTFLLRDSLGGNAKTILVANVHPNARCFGESLSTLNFARRAKMIRNKAVVNEDTSGNISQLHAEIKRLKALLQRYKAQTAVSPTSTNTPSHPFSSQAPPPLSHSPPLSGSMASSSDDEKTIQELRNMLAASMETRDMAQTEKMDLLDRVEKLQQLCNKKDKYLQSTKMILKFRESHISNLEKARKRLPLPASAGGGSGGSHGDGAAMTTPLDDDTAVNTINLLKQEVEQLKYLVEHHPEGNRLARENINLKAELKELRSAPSKEVESRQLERAHRYTLQLEKQLRYYLAKGSNDSTHLKLTTPPKSTLDLESLQLRCKQLQEELEKTRRGWSSDRDHFHLRESKLEASLAAAKKANMELERSLEALKLKNSVEKATLNDIHMTTIKNILTPKREREHHYRSRSMSCTPGNGIVRRSISTAGIPPTPSLLGTAPPYNPDTPSSPHFSSSPARLHQLNFGRAASADSAKPSDSSPLSPHLRAAEGSAADTPPLLPAGASSGATTPHAKKPRLSMLSPSFRTARDDVSSLSEEREEEEEEGGVELDEVALQGALTDELKILQDRNRSLQRQLEGAEKRAGHLTRSKGAFEAQVQELKQLSHLESESYYEKEQGYLEKVATIASQLAEHKSTSELLSSEVHDLRVCLQSADKELRELKMERREERRAEEANRMNQLQQISELEQALEESKSHRVLELELQNLQDEVETLREERAYKEEQMERVLKREKEVGVAHEKEVQGLWDKLTVEVEKNTKLSLELQEGQNGTEELVSLVNENSLLQNRVDELELEQQSHLQLRKSEMESAESTINTLLRQREADRFGTERLVGALQELKQEKAREEARVAALAQDLEESGKELGVASQRGEELVGEVTRLREELSKMSVAHSRELVMKEAEREVVLDDLEGLTDQYQQLNTAFQSQAGNLAETKEELVRVKVELESSEEELNRLLQEKMERRRNSVADADKVQSLEEEESWTVDTNAQDEIEQLKRRLEQAAAMIENYEESREEKNRELQQLKDQLLLLEKLQCNSDSQQATITELSCQLSRKAELEDVLDAQLQEVRVQVEQLEGERRLLAEERERVSAENEELRERHKEEEEMVVTLTEQIERFKSTEESLFQEKEGIRSQLETLREEKAKLSKECEKLAKENAAITGHQNIRQRIQYHATIKVENAKLKEEVIQLQSRLKRKTEQVDKLQNILTENGLDMGKTSAMTTISSSSSSSIAGKKQRMHTHTHMAAESALHSAQQLKENILPS